MKKAWVSEHRSRAQKNKKTTGRITDICVRYSQDCFFRGVVGMGMSQLLGQRNGSYVLSESHKATICLVAPSSTSSHPQAHRPWSMTLNIYPCLGSSYSSLILEHTESRPSSLCLSFLFLMNTLQDLHCIGKHGTLAELIFLREHMLFYHDLHSYSFFSLEG